MRKASGNFQMLFIMEEWLTTGKLMLRIHHIMTCRSSTMDGNMSTLHVSLENENMSTLHVSLENENMSTLHVSLEKWKH